MISIQNITYAHHNKDVLFSNLNWLVNNQEKIALIGNNGTGKSTLLQLIAGTLMPINGSITTKETPYYIPQLIELSGLHTVSDALGITEKRQALHRILDGEVNEINLSILNEDWNIEEQSHDALQYWQTKTIDLDTPMQALSGGERTKVLLAGITIHKPKIVLLDEPSNHLDHASRQLLYQLILTFTGTLVVVSHDRKLLNCLNKVCELTTNGIDSYGGNYDFYLEQKQLAMLALKQDIWNKESALKHAKEKERESIERQQKLNARGYKKQEKAGVAKIMMNTMRNNAEKSTAKLKDTHSNKIDSIRKELYELRNELPDLDKIKLAFTSANLHKGKILFKASNINYKYNNQTLWSLPVEFELVSGERWSINGNNGSGKSTLLKLIVGALQPSSGNIYSAIKSVIYIDQHYSLLNDNISVYDQVMHYNTAHLEEHEIKIRLTWFLFHANDWDKKCSMLSGGERMRLALCCLTTQKQAPEVIVLDEPTNNLDLQNIEIMSAAIRAYTGTLIVVSHDKTFLEELDIHKAMTLAQQPYH